MNTFAAPKQLLALSWLFAAATAWASHDDIVVVEASRPTAIGYSSVPAALEALQANPEARFSTEDGWTIITVPEKPFDITWSFTPEGHPAHPAVIKMSSLNNNGAIFRDLKTLCHAEQAACDQLLDDFILTLK